MSVNEILNEREKTHGDFEDVAVIAGTLRGELMCYENSKDSSNEKMSNSQKMALEMICLKMARIICGDPNFADHWDDIAGYAMLGKGASSKMEHMQEELSEFEKEYCVPFECMNGVIHQWVPCATEKNQYVVNGPAPTECAYCQKDAKKEGVEKKENLECLNCGTPLHHLSLLGLQACDSCIYSNFESFRKKYTQNPE